MTQIEGKGIQYHGASIWLYITKSDLTNARMFKRMFKLGYSLLALICSNSAARAKSPKRAIQCWRLPELPGSARRIRLDDKPIFTLNTA